MVDVIVGDAGLGASRGAGDAEGAREGKSSIWLTILDTLAGAEEVDGPLVKPGASSCGDSLVCSAAAKIKAPPSLVISQHRNRRNG